jgi:hypothetical protein
MMEEDEDEDEDEKKPLHGSEFGLNIFSRMKMGFDFG